MSKFRRRHLIQGVVVSALFSLMYSFQKLWNSLNGKNKVNLASIDRLSILQGATSLTQTQISICCLKDQAIKVFAIDSSGNNITPSQLITNTAPHASHQFLTVIFADLLIHETYTLIVQNEQAEELDRRTFKTLDVNKTEATCALISCAHDRNANIQEDMWKAVERSAPDVLFLLGDNVYVDWHEALPPSGVIDEAHLWKRYIQIRNLLYLYKMTNLIPVFAIWDDHDIGTNDGAKDSPLIKEATEIFNIAFPRHNIDPTLKRTHGIGYHLKLFGLEIMMMDDRTFRTLKIDAHPSHWGVAQEAWVEDTLENAKSPVWIMNGSQFFGAYRQGQRQSFELIHSSNFNNWFLKKIAASPNPVLLTSGDIHYSEVQKIEAEVVGYSLYEITSSSIHSTKKYLKAMEGVDPNHVIESNSEKRRMAVTGEFNFILASIKTNPNTIKIEAKSIGLHSIEYFKVAFSVSKNKDTSI